VKLSYHEMQRFRIFHCGLGAAMNPLRPGPRRFAESMPLPVTLTMTQCLCFCLYDAFQNLGEPNFI